MTNWREERDEARSIGEILLAEEAVSRADFERAKMIGDERGMCVEEVLQEEGKVTEELLQRAIAEHFRVPTEGQFSLGAFSPEWRYRILAPILRLLFGEQKAHLCIFKLSCRDERRRRRLLKKEALLESKIEEEKKQRREHREMKKKGMETLLPEGMPSENGRTPLLGKFTRTLTQWKTQRAEKQIQRNADRQMRKDAKRKEQEERALAKEILRAEKEKQKEAARAEKKAAREAARIARREALRAKWEMFKAFLKRPVVVYGIWKEQRAILREQRKAEAEVKREERRLQAEQKKAEKAALREAAKEVRRVRLQAFFAKFSWKGKSAEQKEAKETARLTEEACREAIRQVYIEREKRKLKEQLGEPVTVPSAAAPSTTVVVQSGGSGAPVMTAQGSSTPVADPLEKERAALLLAKQQLEVEQARMAEEKKHLAEEQKTIVAKADREKEERARVLREAEEKFQAEKERIAREAVAKVEARIADEKHPAAAVHTKKETDPALTKELEQWKKQVEKLEGEKKEMEQKRVLQEEQEKIRKEERRIEEEKILRERTKIEQERMNLIEEESHKKRIMEETEEVKLMRKKLEEEKKRVEKTKMPAEKKVDAPITGTTPPPAKVAKPLPKMLKKDVPVVKPANAIDIGKILLAQNYIDEKELAAAEAAAKERNVTIDLILKDEGLVTKELLQNAIAEFYKIPFVDLRSQPPDPAIIELLPENFSVAYSAVAIQKNADGSLLVATSSPEQATLIPEIKKLLPQMSGITLAYAPKESIESALTFYRKPLDTRFRKILEEHKKVAPEIIEEIFGDAVQLGASDIHFEPQEKIVIVRFRVDGVMHEAGRIPKEFYEGIVNRIKIAGNMRIDEHFTAQDGAIRWKSGEKSMDVRVSIVPIVDGEKIVMRLLSEYVRTLTLSDLGFTTAQKEVLVKAAHKPFGMILTTGPTGSGKSTTLYGLMKIRNTPDVNISTIEDPVEYKIAGINHIQVNVKTDLTFERGLRALVRQDPDIILVGEIRDNVTAQISVNAALTGHLLFSTLHANDAATAVPRLLEMGIEPYLLASTLELIIAQRLMRRVCLNCRFSYTIPRKEACGLFLNAEHYFPPQEPIVTLYRGKGCAACGDTGYKGRVGVYELLIVTQELEDAIVQRRTTADINDISRAQGMLTLFEDGLEKVKSGFSTIEELLRIAAPPDTIITRSPSSPDGTVLPQAE